MLFTDKPHIEDVLIKTLSKRADQDAKELLTSVHKVFPDTTVQGLYRALRKLHTEGVVIKNKQLYSLRIAWVLDMATYLQTMEQTYIKSSYLERFIPAGPGKKRVWRFRNLHSLNNFWSQVLIAVAQVNEPGPSVTWCPHPWFNLFHPVQEKQFTRMFLHSITTDYIVVGFRTFLDQRMCRYWDAIPNTQYYIAQPHEAVDKKPGRSISVIGDTIVSIQLDPHTTREIERIFALWNTREKIDRAHIRNLFVRSGRILRISVHRDEKEAARLRKKFERLFGPIT